MINPEHPHADDAIEASRIDPSEEFVVESRDNFVPDVPTKAPAQKDPRQKRLEDYQPPKQFKSRK